MKNTQRFIKLCYCFLFWCHNDWFFKKDYWLWTTVMYRSDLTWIFNQLPAHKQVIALSATYPKELEDMVSFCCWMFFLIFWRNYVSVESSCRRSWKKSNFWHNFRYNVWDNFANNFWGISDTILWNVFQCFNTKILM